MKTFKFSKSFFVLFTLCLSLSLFSSCVEDEKLTDLTREYYIGFSNLGYASGTEAEISEVPALSEMREVIETYKKAIGVSSNPFTLEGDDLEANDRKVAEACKAANEQFKSKAFSNYFELEITRGTVKVYAVTYGTK